MLKVLGELVRKDMYAFFSDFKAVFFTFAVPIAIASFLGSMFGGVSSGTAPSKVPIEIVDEDHSAATAKVIERLRASDSLAPTVVERAKAEADTKKGDIALAVVFPKEFGDQATAAIGQNNAPKPSVTLLTDPSKGSEIQMGRGLLLQTIMQGLYGSVYGQTPSPPFEMAEHAQTSDPAKNWSGSAHAFAGMAVQALFFGALEGAIGMMRDRQSGLWARLKASPISPWWLLAGKFLGSAILSLFVFLGVFGAGCLFFGYRVNGSLPGFALVACATAAMAAGVGLFIAALGRTEAQSRRLSVLVILIMLMLGGAWMPSFLMPQWIQSLALFTPVRWAVDGIDAMTFRGLQLDAALPSVGVLLLFAFGLTFIAGRRFRWEPEG